MTNEMENYSVAALAAKLGVPRTTINDWLGRYGNYIDSENVGRRRIFSERSLTVLQEIAALRDQGKSGFEIEAELMRRHGVSPEIAAPKPSEAAMGNPAPAPAAAPPPEFSLPPALRNLERNFSDLGAWMCDMREYQLAQRRRQRWMFAMVLISLLLLLAGSLAGWRAAVHAAERREQENHVLQNELSRVKTDLSDRMTTQLSSLEKQIQDERRHALEQAELDKKQSQKIQEESMAKVQAALNAERKQWASDVQKLQQDALARQDAERRELLDRWEKSARESEARLREDAGRTQEELKRLKSELVTANQKLEEARKALAERPVTVPAVAPVPAAAAPAPMANPPAAKSVSPEALPKTDAVPVPASPVTP